MPTKLLTRPADGKCARCGADLPPEHSRADLTLGTDVCQRCALSKRSLATSTPAAKAWLSAWRDRLGGLERDNLE